MQFTSITFLAFFFVSALLYGVLPDKLKKYWLCIINVFFCACFGIAGAFVLMSISLISYLVGRIITAKPNKVVVPIVSIGWIVFLSVWKLIAQSNTSSYLVFTIGVSFYSLMAVGYILDVYRGKCEAQKDFFTFLGSMTLFGCLQSGPIVKVQDIFPQIQNPKRVSYETVRSGLLIMLWGCFEKIAIADISGVIVNEIFDNYSKHSGLAIILATIIYAFQLYADFDGYSNIALGAMRIIGIDVIRNFDAPYLSKSVGEFWRRWHISLSTWLKDYVYIPLGGSRSGNRYVNLMATFIVSGIWHGSGLNFLVWGLLHGLYQILEKALDKKTEKRLEDVKHIGFGSFLRIIRTFILVDFAWFFFRVPNLSVIWDMITGPGKVSFAGAGILTEIISPLSWVQLLYLLVGLLCLVVSDVIRYRTGAVMKHIERLPLAGRWIIYMTGIWMVIIIAIAGLDLDASQFIYGQF